MRVCRYMVHDPESTCIPGDKILFEKSRPFSKRKHWVFRVLLARDAAAEYLRTHPEIAAQTEKVERKRRSAAENTSGRVEKI